MNNQSCVLNSAVQNFSDVVHGEQFQIGD